jgi:hypothetical protein
VNCTACPTAGDAGANVKDDASVDILATVTVCDPCLVQELPRATSVTVYDPSLK